MFKKLLAKFGAGAADVDLVLSKDRYELGETIVGEFVVKGGEVEQQINRIDVDFVVSIWKNGREYTQLITRKLVSPGFHIHSKERKVIPFSYDPPKDILVSGEFVRYFFVTNLDIDAGKDSSDRDYIQILAPLRLQGILHAFEKLGFQEETYSRSFDGYSQIFAFVPMNDSYQVNEIVFKVALEEEGVRLLLEVDIPSFIGEKEVKREVWMSNEWLSDENRLTNYLHETIQTMITQPYAYTNFSSIHFESGQKYSGNGIAVGALGGVVAGMFVSNAIDQAFEEEDNNQDEEEFTGFFGDEEPEM